MAGNYNFDIEQGSTFNRKITWKDSKGQQILFTDTTQKMQIRIKKSDGELYLDCSDYIFNNNTFIEIVIPSDVTKSLQLRNETLVYDLLVTKSDSVHKIMEGRVVVIGGVTK